MSGNRKGRDPERPPMDAQSLAPMAHPTPDEVELMGLGVMVATLSRMSAAERLHSLDYLASRYGHRVPGLQDGPARVELEEEAQALTDLIVGARLTEVRFGSYALARIILDAGYRRPSQEGTS